MITLIAACARGGAIGRDGTIPWDAPEDLAFFMRETLGGAVIMGRRTWDSLPVKPLKGRMNCVVTSRDLDSVATYGDVALAIEAAHAAGHRRIYGIGGAGIYDAMMDRADRVLITEVALDVPGADTFFPPLDPGAWHLAGTHRLRDTAPVCVLHEYLRPRAGPAARQA